MSQVQIPLTAEQQKKIKDVTGLDISQLTVEKIEDDRPGLDLSVEELEDRVNPAIESPAASGSYTQLSRNQLKSGLNAGSIYLGVAAATKTLFTNVRVV